MVPMVSFHRVFWGCSSSPEGLLMPVATFLAQLLPGALSGPPTSQQHLSVDIDSLSARHHRVASSCSIPPSSHLCLLHQR